MVFLRRVSLSVAAIIVYQFMAPTLSYAYLDPGTGSYILQMAMAAALGSMFAIKMFWKRIVAFISGLFSGKKNEESK